MTRWRREFVLRMLLAVWMCCTWMFFSLYLTRGPLKIWRLAHAQIAREKDNVRAEHERLRKLQEMASTHDGILQDMETIEPTPPRKLYLPSLVSQLAQIAAQNAMTLVGVTPLMPELEDGATVPEMPKDGPLRVVATFRGHYSDFAKLVDGLQQFQKAVAIAGLNLRTDRTATDGTLLAEVTLLAREVPGVRDMKQMTTPPAVPPTLLQKFNKKTVDQILNGGEPAPAGAAPTPLLPGPPMPPLGGPAPAPPATSAPPLSGPPASGPAAKAPPTAPAGSGGPAGAPKGLPARPLGLPAPPLGLPAPPLGEPKPNEPGMMELDPGSLPKPKIAPATPADRQGKARPAPTAPDLGPARVVANVGVMRRMWRMMRVDGLMPGSGGPNSDKIAMGESQSKDKAR